MGLKPVTATTKEILTTSKEAGENLESKQYKLVKVNSEGQLVSAASGDTPFVLLNNPASGEYGTIAVNGIVKVIAGGTIHPGEYVAATNAGTAQVAVSGQRVVGLCTFGGESGGYVEVLAGVGAKA